MRSRTRVAAAGLVAGSVLLSGCAVLGFAATPEQSVAEACASFDGKKMNAALKTLRKSAPKGSSLKTLAKAADTFTTVLEDGIAKVENPTVKMRAQMTSIALRNVAAEFRTFKPNRTHLDHLKADIDDLTRQSDKLQKLCERA